MNVYKLIFYLLVSEEAMELLLYIVGQLERSSVATFSTSVTASLVVLTSEFKINQVSELLASNYHYSNLDLYRVFVLLRRMS